MNKVERIEIDGVVAAEFIKCKPVTIEQVLNSNASKYNRSEWGKIVSRYATYEDCRFYFVGQSSYGIDKFFVTYKLDGVPYILPVSYHSCLSGGSFMEYTVSTIRDPKGVERSFIHKHSYSCYQDTSSNRKLFAIRAKVDGNKDCYSVFTKEGLF